MVAICVVFVPAAAVGAVGVPVKFGEFIGAFAAKSVVKLVTCDSVIAISLNVAVTLPSTSSKAVIVFAALGVPVKVSVNPLIASATVF